MGVECANSAQCAPFKHHFDECVERVHAQHSDAGHKGPKEDCVEECEFPSFLSTLHYEIMRIAVNWAAVGTADFDGSFCCSGAGAAEYGGYIC